MLSLYHATLSAPHSTSGNSRSLNTQWEVKQTPAFFLSYASTTAQSPFHPTPSLATSFSVPSPQPPALVPPFFSPQLLDVYLLPGLQAHPTTTAVGSELRLASGFSTSPSSSSGYSSMSRHSSGVSASSISDLSLQQHAILADALHGFTPHSTSPQFIMPSFPVKFPPLPAS